MFAKDFDSLAGTHRGCARCHHTFDVGHSSHSFQRPDATVRLCPECAAQCAITKEPCVYANGICVDCGRTLTEAPNV